jgi:anti-anti-sigma factor
MSRKEHCMAGKKNQKTADAPAGGVYRITVDRDMTGAHVNELEARFALEIARAGKGPVVLDLTAVRQIDSRGITLCIGLFKECKASGLGFSIHTNPDLHRFFRVLKLTKVIDIREESSV